MSKFSMQDLLCYDGPLDGCIISMPECLKFFSVNLEGTPFGYMKQTFSKQGHIILQRWAGFDVSTEPGWCINSFEPIINDN